MRKKKEWSYKAGERGVNRVRVFRHWKTRGIFVEYTEHGKKRRHALRGFTQEAAKRKAEQMAATYSQQGTPDANVEPHVVRWLEFLKGKKAVDTIDHYRNVIRQLIPAGSSFTVSRLVPGVLQSWLDRIDASAGTQRKYHAAVSQLCKYLINIGVLPANPMRRVQAPRPAMPRCRYLENADVLRLVNAQEEPYRALSALIHATGMEVSVAVSLMRRDIDKTTNNGYAIVAQGTKNAWRIRRVYLDPWAVPYLERQIALLTPDAPLFPGVNRWMPSKNHRTTCEVLGIKDYTLRDARHTWAVRAARAGASPEVMRRQLGHKDTLMVMKVYAAYMPNEAEMTTWHGRAAERDKQAAVF